MIRDGLAERWALGLGLLVGLSACGAVPAAETPPQPLVVGAPEPPPPSAPSWVTWTEGCSQGMAPSHVLHAPRKVEGGPAHLTPEGAEAGLHGSVKATCVISLLGKAPGECLFQGGVPESQARAVRQALASWRFLPATWDGIPIASEHELTIPLVTPPPGWMLPEPPPRVTIDFKTEMTAPRLVSGPPSPLYTRAALERCIQGKVRARCKITIDGALMDCDIVQSVPHQDQAVLAMLAEQRYTPVLWKGKAQSVYYVLTFNFQAQ